MQDEFKHLPIAEINRSATNPRSYFDEKKILELAESIKEVGILQNLIVRPINGGYELVSGERRLRAATIVGLEEVPCNIKELSDEAAFETAIIENLHREDVHPMDEAVSFKRMIENPRYNVHEICLRIGKKEDYVLRRLKLNDLIDDVKQLFYENKIEFGHAIQLARLQPADQEKCFEWLNNRSYGTDIIRSVSELTAYINSYVILKLEAASFPKKDATLYPEAGACIVCPKRSGYNQSLFIDIENKDRCFDSACFNEKLKRHLQRKAQELKDNKINYKVITLDHYVYDHHKKEYPNIIGGGNYTKIENKKDRCEHAEKGLIVNGTNVGQVLDICANSKCKTHYSSTGSYSYQSPEEKIKQKLQRGIELDAEKVYKQTMDALAEVPEYINPSSSRLLTAEENFAMIILIYDSLGYEKRQDIVKRLGWWTDLYKNGSWFDSTQCFKDNLEKATHQELSFIIRYAIFEKFNSYTPTSKEAKLMRTIAATTYEIPVDEFENIQSDIRKKREEAAGKKLQELAQEMETKVNSVEPAEEKTEQATDDTPEPGETEDSEAAQEPGISEMEEKKKPAGRKQRLLAKGLSDLLNKDNKGLSALSEATNSVIQNLL